MSSGAYTQLVRFPSSMIDIEQVKAGLLPISPENHYNYMKTLGLAYGPSFQVIRQIWTGEKEALLSIGLNQNLDVHQAYHLHPILLDACFQGVACAVREQGINDLFLPAAIGTLQIYKKEIIRSLWCYIQVQEATDQEMISNIDLIHESGELVGRISKFVLRRLQHSIMKTDNLQDLYTLKWIEVDNISQPNKEPRLMKSNSCLIFADHYKIGEGLAQHLDTASILVYPGEKYQKLSNGQYLVNPSKKEELLELFDEVKKGSAGGEISHVVYCWGMNISEWNQGTGIGVPDQFADAYTNLVHLVQLLSTVDAEHATKLWIITHQAQQVQQGKELSLFQAPFWGFGRTLAVSNPELWGGLIDLGIDMTDDQAVKRACQRIVHDLASNAVEKQIAYHHEKKFVARLDELGRQNGLPATRPVQICTEHAYLITGGLGSLGLAFAHWLAKQGAKQLVLMGRTVLPPRETWDFVQDERLRARINGVQDLEKLGVDVRIIPIDVSSKAEMDAFFNHYKNQGVYKIKGIIHAAGIVYNQSIDEITQEDLLKIMKPKMLGGLYLQQHFRDSELDFFALFSSMTSLIAPPRLAIYAAANAFLDTLAHQSYFLGLPAISINWGPWAEAGMAAQGNASNQTAGMQNMSVEDGIAYFEQAIKLELPQVAIAQVNWQTIYRMFPSVAQTPFLENLVHQGLQQDQVVGESSVFQLEEAIGETKEVRQQLVKDFLLEQACSILKVAAAVVEEDTPLNTLGLDSMMALEFSNRIEGQTKVNIPMATFLKGATIAELAGQIELELENSNPIAEVKEQIETYLSESKAMDQMLLKAKEYPLSHGQRSLWFLQEISPENTAYNVGFAVQVYSGLDIENLKTTLTHLVARHEALRLKVLNMSGEILQRIESSPNYEFILQDVQGKTEKEIRELVNQDLHRPYRLDQDCMLRTYVYQGTHEHIVMFVIHHIAIDYWGIELFLKDFKAIYTSLVKKQKVDISVPTHSYSEFVAWQADFMTQHKAQQQLDYWVAQLNGGSHELDLPIDYPFPKVQRFEGASVQMELDKELVHRIKALIRAEETTLFVFLLAAYQLLLHRYSGQNELIVGSPTSGRSQASFHSVIGDFINMLSLKSNIEENPTFLMYLRDSKRTVLNALEHQDYPFPLLVEKIKPNRNLTRSPIFQASFILQSMSQLPELRELIDHENSRVSEFAGLQIKPYPIAQQEGQLDLTLELTESTEKIVGVLKYNKQLFKQTTIERMIRSYCTLIERIVAEPDKKVKELDLLPTNERQQLWSEWGNNPRAFPQYQNLFEYIEHVALQNPHRSALEYEGIELSYTQLMEQAYKVAHSLNQLGIEKGERVGIYMHRGLEMVTAILGAMKVGAVYVPMDPAFPPDRLNWMVEDGEMRFILTKSDLEKSNLNKGAAYVMVDEMIKQQNGLVHKKAPVQVTPEDCAYVIYTSGSTGKPKGVEIQHKALINFLQSMAISPGIQQKDRLLAVTTLSFDISVLEIFLPLTVGAKTLILSRQDTIDGKRLQNKMELLRPTMMQATPATWRMLLDSGWQGDPKLKALCGGEALPLDLAKQLKLNCATLWNLYGPTEATVWMCMKEIQADPGKITLGKPIHNMEAYVLDEYLNPVPVGVAGHLYIGGIGLAKGYLNRPDLNEEKFSFIGGSTGHDGKRVYSTGDLARWLPTGELEYLGRSDNQVKINGYRIELGEIESLLNIHPGISEAVVTADKSSSPARLVAFIKMGDMAVDIKVEELRTYLRKQLPEYMIPAAFVKINEIPLTPNGKVDRNQLQHLEGSRLELATAFSAPETKIEKEISEIWMELLQTKQIGINDNFFDLGGSSLLAAQLHQALKERLGLQVTILDIFQYPTIHSLSKHLTATPTNEMEHERVEKLAQGKRRLDLLRMHRRGARK